MTIQFHCEHCGKKITAPPNTGGKRGKCPACGNSIYVPEEHHTNDEELKLAPLDDNQEKTREQLLAETFSLTRNILDERTLPDIPPEQIPSNVQEPFVPSIDLDPKELRKTIIKYLRWMAEDQVEDAQNLVDVIGGQREQSQAIIDQIALSEIPEAELAHIQPHVLSGLIRTLRSQLG